LVVSRRGLTVPARGGMLGALGVPRPSDWRVTARGFAGARHSTVSAARTTANWECSDASPACTPGDRDAHSLVGSG
jgi:hypothetical protein